MTVNVLAQNSPQLNLKTGKFNLANNLESLVIRQSFSAEELSPINTYYRIAHFSELPDAEQRSQLAAAGIELLDYLPTNAYYASIRTDADLNVLKNLNGLGLTNLQKEFKLSKDLLSKSYPEWALLGNETIGLNVLYFANIDREMAIEAMTAFGAQIINADAPEMIQVQVPMSRLDALYDLSIFYYFETLDQPGEPEGFDDVSNHRSNVLQNVNGFGSAYTGNDVTIMMQDDGPIGPHIDYEGRITTRTTADAGDHGDHVAGIIMGAGNLNPIAIGNAPGAHLLVYSSNNANYNAVPNLYDDEHLVITSKSYGNGNNAGYTALARQLDIQCNDKDALVHVFSAGNSGGSNFGYGAGAGWGNITGGHKQGKNVLAVGNLSALDQLAGSSSRGPADDGRIKPDICAVGTNVFSTVDVNTYENKTGTSMACPGVAGSVALLYEAYRDDHSDQDPPAALINGAILNTAEDLGNPGPDFRFGWGRINVRRALAVIKANQYLSAEVDNGGSMNHTIQVPAGTKQVRVMVYWTDYQGSTSAATALVNNLNMSIDAPDGTNFSPWVLNPTPVSSLLNADAVRGIDDLNNVEQITIDDPEAGAYQITIDGASVPQGPQQYFVVYEFVKDDLILNYPIGGESLAAGSQEVIRWEALGENENFKLEYSIDGGASWELLSGSLPATRRYYTWSIPFNMVSGLGKVRLTRGNVVTENDKVFSIMRQPTNLDVEWACPNSFNFSWNPVQGAVGYEVSLLGEKYMDSVGVTTETNATVYANTSQTQWVSVKALGPDGAIGRRAIALRKTPGAFGCTLDPPVADITVDCDQIGSGSCVRFQDLSVNAGLGAAWEWSFPGGSPSTSTDENPVICYANDGVYDVSLTVKNGVGEDVVNITQLVEVKSGKVLPFVEDFESGILAEAWSVESESAVNWEVTTDASAYGQGFNSIAIDHAAMIDAGSVSTFTTQPIDLSADDLVYDLVFDVAYAYDGSSNDSLIVYYTTNCGLTKTKIFESGGADLSTGTHTAGFVPTADEWQHVLATMNDLTNRSSVRFIFESKSAQGGTMYVDNINVEVSSSNFPEGQLTVFPNPVQGNLKVAGMQPEENTKIDVLTTSGKVVYSTEFIAQGGVVNITLPQLAAGMYFLRVESDTVSDKVKFLAGIEE